MLWLAGLSPFNSLSGSPAAGPDPVDTTLQVTICANEHYIFNGDTLDTPGEYLAVFEAYDGSDSVVLLQLAVLPTAEQTVSASICNGEMYEFNGESLTQSGTYTAVLPAENGCDSTITLHLTVLPSPLNKRKAGICEGASYLFEGDTLTESGIYTKIWPAANGCDSFVVLDLKVVPFFEIPVQATVCHGAGYIFGNDTLYQSGVYVDTLVAAGGCDSIVTLTLDVLPAIVTDLEISICQGEYYLFNGDTLTETVLVTAVLEAANGCDSTVIVALLVLPVSKTTIEASVCDGTTFDYNGDNLYAPGTYQYIFPGENGCDSTVTIVLEEIFPQFKEISASICPGSAYEFNGASLTEEGFYTATLTGGNGCDSTVTLDLTFLPEFNTQLTASICPGSAYPFNGENLTQAGTYTAVFPAQNGCDSTVTLKLTLLPELNTALEATICAGDTYEYNGLPLTIAGVYEFVLNAENGCDSTVTLNLNVLPVSSAGIEASICQGSSYEYQGESLTESGTYTFELQAENGCDSTVTLILKVLPASSTALEATICAGASYPFGVQQLTVAGDYTAIYSGENGCDSTVTLHLKVVPFFETGLEATICAGDFYLFGNDTLTESGLYLRSLEASGGCDSLVILALSVLPAATSTLEAGICAGEVYAFNGENLTESGVYTADLEAFNGCDSTVTLYLTVWPKLQTTLEATTCGNKPFEFNGEPLSASGIYTATLSAENGCDSIVTLYLTVLPVPAVTLEATICQGISYEYHGQSLTEAGIYPFTLEGENGCDSLVTLHLAVLPVQTSSLEATICKGDAYEYNGQSLTAAGAYEFTLEGPNGCDSLVILILTVQQPVQNAFAVLNCNGESYEYNGEELTESGIYEFTFVGEAANGCDSVVTVYLTIFPAIPPTQVSAVICAGDTYDFFGTGLTDAGTYSYDMPSVNGCDSTIVLELGVLPAVSTTVDASVCKGEAYHFADDTLFAPGTYTTVFESVNGCDSMVTLHLAVISVDDDVELSDGVLTAQADDATFQWIDCDANHPVPGATGSTFAPAVTGNYAVVITQNGCTDTSGCYLVEVLTSQEPSVLSAWTLQPNPASQRTAIVFDQTVTEELRAEVYDEAGRLLYRQQITAGTGRVEIDLDGMPGGMLLVRLAGQTGDAVKFLLKSDR